MASISSYDSSSLGILFSSMNSSKKSGASTIGMGTSDLLGINYSDYATIRSGSYFKLMKAYYSEGLSDDLKDAVANKTTTTTATSRDKASLLTGIQSASDDVKEAADTLLAQGSKSVFKEESKTDENGKVTKQYDLDGIYKALESFVDGYNSLVTQASRSNTSNISGAEERLENLTRINAKQLAAVGITMDSDQKLSIDKDTFEKADMTRVKSLFQATGGYGYQVSAQASMIHYYAENEASRSSTYGSNGSYTYNYISGELYNTGI